MQKILNNLKNNSLLQISNWWGLRDAGKSGAIITKDKMLYKYTFYHRLSPFLEKNNIPKEYISPGIKLSNEEYQRTIKFIEKDLYSSSERIKMYLNLKSEINLYHSYQYQIYLNL